jgi:hypothetical protein
MVGALILIAAQKKREPGVFRQCNAWRSQSTTPAGRGRYLAVPAGSCWPGKGRRVSREETVWSDCERKAAVPRQASRSSAAAVAVC